MGRPGRIPLACAALAFVGGAAALRFRPGPEPERSGPPYLLLHDWYGESPVASPSYIREHAEYLDALPFDGIVTYVRSADCSINVSARVMGTEPLSREEIEDCLAPLREVRFANLKENFAAVLGGRPPDFLDDWAVPVENFARLADAARDAGLRGIYFDNEGYHAPWGNHPEGVSRPDVPLAEYQRSARERGRRIMEAMTERFPDIVVVVLHGPYISEPRAPSPLFQAWHHANELLGPFFAGFAEGAGERATLVDGGELYHLRSDAEFRDARAWRRTGLPSPEVDCAFLPGGLREKWPERVRIGFGVYDRPFKGRGMDPAILASTLAHALRRSDAYVWLYIEGPTFLKPEREGGAPRDWIDAVRKSRRARRE